MRRLSVGLTSLIVLVLLLAAPVAAQEATPATAGDRLDLAAMVLGADDLPAGYDASYEEHYFTLEEGIDRDITGGAPSGQELAEAGLRAFYRSISFGDDGTILRLYVEEYTSAEAAAVGFDLTEDETRPVPEGVTILTAVDLPGPGVGEEPAETSVLAGEEAGFGRFSSVDATFRVDRLLAGVAIEAFVPFDEDPAAADGTPATDAKEAMPAADAGDGTPTARDEAWAELTADVAATFHERIETVLAGTEPAGIDFALPGLVLPINETWPHPGLIPEGYRDATEMLVGEPGVGGGSLDQFTGEFESGYARTVAAGSEAGNPEVIPPFVTIGVSAFATADDARAVLAAAREAPAGLPVPGPVGRGEDRELADEPALDEVDAELAHTSAFNEEGRVDSAGVAFVVGELLVTVDVQGAADAEAAMDAAVALAQQQADCLADGGPCDEVEALPELEAPAGATEEGTPAP